MRFRSVLILASLATTGVAHADVRATTRTRLIEAIAKHDTRTVESLVALPLRAEKLRFWNEECRKFWGVAVLVHTSELPAFVSCLAGEKVTAAPAGAATDAIYGPGFPLDIAFNADDKVTALTSASDPGSKPLRIDPTTFAAHVTKLAREIAPSAATQRAMQTRGSKAVRAELSLCVDETGATVPIASVADPALRSYEQDVAAAARAWKIQPFDFGGKPRLACASYIVGYPGSSLDQPAASPTEPSVVGATALEKLRTRGTPFIKPDAETKNKIAETDGKHVIAMFKLCIDVKGAPASITILKPSGYDAYDQKLEREMRTWAYKPWVVAGTAVPVCTAVTFVYDLR